MKNHPINQKYQIKVNRISSENDKLFPYSKYLKNNYSQLRKIAPKNSILYKLKIKPEIIINEYHQTSNNINTNINIKTNPDNSHLNNTSINNISFNGQPNNFPFNKYYGDYENENSIKNVKNIDKSYNKERNIRNTDYIPKKNNIYQNCINNENNNLSEVFSPYSNCYSAYNREKEYKKRDLNYMKDINYDNLNVDKNRIAKIFYKSPLDESKKYETSRQIKNNLYSDYGKNYIKSRKNISQEMISTQNDIKYKKRKNPSINLEKYNSSQKVEPYDSGLDSFRARKMKEMNDIVFSPSNNPLMTILGNKINQMDKNLITKDNIDNSKDSLNIKLEYYRIKLFKEFLKHFNAFYIGFLRKIFQIFLKNAKNYIKPQNDTNNFIYNKKSYIKFNNTIDNNSLKKIDISKNKNYENDEMEKAKSSTANNYYKIYNKYKRNKNSDANSRSMFNSYTLKKEMDNSKNENINNTITSSNNKHYLNSAPRINKNSNNYSITRNQNNNLIINSSSKSPSFRFGNKTIINNDISFRADGNEKENELFRDSRELNKKYEQIQRRKKKSQIKNREIYIDDNSSMNFNKSEDVDNIKNSEEYNEFAELRKYIKNLKKDYNSHKNTINASRNNRNNFFVKINSYEVNNANSFENDENIENSNNKIYNKTYYNNRFKNDNYEQKEKTDSFKKISVNRDGREGISRKKKGERINKNKFLNINVIDKMNEIKDNSNIVSNDEDRSFKKVRVNINKRFLPNSENNKTNNNYSHRIINSNPQLNTSPYKKNNIYYSKVNNTEKFKPTLIKDIFTKDKRIHINICYYNFSKMNNSNKKIYEYLSKSNNSSVDIPGEIAKRKNNISKLKFKLASIKEEDISNQNSKIYDESGTFGNNNTYESKKNYIINNHNQNDSLYNKFINIINNLIMKRFVNKLKKINKNNNNKNNINNENNIKSKIYSRKNKILNKKIYGNIGKNENNSKINSKKYIIINSKASQYEDKIEKFRIKLIKYYFNNKK